MFHGPSCSELRRKGGAGCNLPLPALTPNGPYLVPSLPRQDRMVSEPSLIRLTHRPDKVPRVLCLCCLGLDLGLSLKCLLSQWPWSWPLETQLLDSQSGAMDRFQTVGTSDKVVRGASNPWIQMPISHDETTEKGDSDKPLYALVVMGWVCWVVLFQQWPIFFHLRWV